MTDYMKYWIPVLILSTAYAGFFLGGDFVWLGIATFPILAILDSIIPRDYRTRNIASPLIANIPIWICAVGPVALFGLLAWRVSATPLTPVQAAGRDSQYGLDGCDSVDSGRA